MNYFEQYQKYARLAEDPGLSLADQLAALQMSEIYWRKWDVRRYAR